MTPENFCYWLRGHFELRDTRFEPTFTIDQMKMIKMHLDLVFAVVIADPAKPFEISKFKLPETHTVTC